MMNHDAGSLSTSPNTLKGGRRPLSAYIRTKNEARMVGDVVRAALQVADEVVIVDSGSTDDTVELARTAGARIITHEWLGNGHQKRIAEEACRNDWLLDLDADEIVTPALAREIEALFERGEPEYRVFRTPMAFVPAVGKPWLGFGGSVRHKLYDRRTFRAPAHAAWDQFKIPSRTPVGRLKAPILHYAFTGAEHLMEKLNRNSSVRAREAPRKSMPVLMLRILFGLPFYFLKRYVLDGLFRGGVYGFAFAMMSGYGRWLRDVKMYEKTRQERER